MSQRRAVKNVIKRLGRSLSDPLDAITYKTQAPEFMVLTQMLSVLSIASQSLVDIRPRNEIKIPVSLYTLILASSGERKSTVDKFVMKPVRETEKEVTDQAVHAQQKYNADKELWDIKKKALSRELDAAYKKGEEPTALIEAYHIHIASEPTLPIASRILAEDITVAKLKSMLAGKNTSLALMSDEAGTLLSSDLIKDNALFCSLWSGKSIRVDRANANEVHIDDARLTFSMQIQPKIYKEFRIKNGDAMRSSGLDARFLFCEPKSEIGYRFEDVDDKSYVEDSIKLGKFSSRIDALLKEGLEYRTQNKPRHCLELTDGAKKVWADKFNDIEYAMRDGGYLEHYKDFGSKFMEQASRIAAVLHVFKYTDYISKLVDRETMETAIDLAEIYLEQAMMIFRAPETREYVDLANANKLLDWIKDNWKDRMFLKSEIRRSGPHCVRDLNKLEDAIEILIDRGDVFCYKKNRSIYISLSWEKYPRHVRLSEAFTLNGRRVDGLVRYYGRYK